MRTYTLRGRIPAQTTRRLIVDDGRYTHGMIVKEFYVWAKSQASSDDPECILTKESTTLNSMDVGVEQIYVGVDQTMTICSSEFSVVLECTVETLSSSAAMALALSQQ